MSESERQPTELSSIITCWNTFDMYVFYGFFCTFYCNNERKGEREEESKVLF